MSKFSKQLLTTSRNNPFNYTSYRGYGGKTRLTPTDQLLVQKGGSNPRTLDLYLNLFADDQVASVVARQLDEITSRPFSIIPGGDLPVDLEAAEFCQEQISSIGLLSNDSNLGAAVIGPDQDFQGIVRALGLALVLGISGVEIVWKKARNGRNAIDYLKVVDPRRFLFVADEKTNVYPKILTKKYPFDGIFLPPKKFIIHRYYAVPSSDPYGLGLGRNLYWLVNWKREALTYWLSIIDKYSDPTTIGTAPNDTSEAEFQEFFQNLRKIAQDGTIAVKEGFNVDTLDVSLDKVEFIEDLINYCDTQIRVLISGEDSVGNDANAGSQARDRISNDVRVMKARALSNSIHSTIQKTLINWLVKLNFPEDTKIPQLIRNFDNTSTTLDTVISLANLGFKIDPEFIEKTFGVPIVQ
jgi:phage gp29-like protein